MTEDRIKVKIKLGIAVPEKVFKKRELEIELNKKATLQELVTRLKDSFPTLSNYVGATFLKNGKLVGLIRGNGLDSLVDEINDGDEIVILGTVGGG